MADWQWRKTADYFSLQWPQPRPCLSSAVLNGGLCQARSLLNLRVGSDTPAPLLTPDQSLYQAAQQQQLAEQCVGLMTAASMNSLRHREANLHGAAVAIFVSCGLSNARRAGDPYDWQADHGPSIGTINSVLITDLKLPVASMVELHGLLSEAKAAVLQELDIRSPRSGKIATGTGTDACAVIGGHGREEKWFGKHTEAGALCAQLYMDALRCSIERSP